MPTYEYACRSCGHHLEVVQSFSDEPLATCPNCGGTLRKVFGSIGIVLKGSGFYKTDSRSTPSETKPAAERPGKSETPAAKEGSSSSADSGGSKPAPATTGSATGGSTTKPAAADGS